MYWRLLSTDPTTAREIVLSEKPPISTETDRMDRQLLDQLLLHGSSLASIFHRVPNTFIRGSKARYMPDSPALDEAARRYASNHIYSKPVQKAPFSAKQPFQPQALSTNGDGVAPASEASATTTSLTSPSAVTSTTETSTAQATGTTSNGGPESGEDPYASLPDDFGATSGGYSADAPRPIAAGSSDLLA